MGKMRNTARLRAGRVNETVTPTDADVEDAEASGEIAPGDNSVSLLDKLKSVDADDRECACNTLAHVVFDPNALPSLIQGDVVSCLANLLLDQFDEVRAEAAGALRNLTVAGGDALCESIAGHDVLNSLLFAVKQALDEALPMAANGDAVSATQKARLELVCRVLEQSFHCLWNLCESSDVVLKRLTASNQLPVIAFALQPNLLPHSMCIAAAQCLYTALEDNDEGVAQFCARPEAADRIVAALNMDVGDSADLLLIRALAAGILLNSSGAVSSISGVELRPQIVAPIAATLDYDGAAALAGLASTLATIPVVQEPPEHRDDHTANTHNSARLALQRVQTALEAQQVALEVLTNLCSSDLTATGGEWEDVDGAEGNDEDETGAVPTTSEVEDEGLPSQIAQAIIASGIPARVVARCRPAPAVQQVYSAHPEGRVLAERLSSCQTAAITCLGNMIETMGAAAVGSGPHELWQGLAEIAAISDKSSDRFVEALTGAMWAVLRTARKGGMEMPTAAVGDISALLRSSSEAVRVHAAGMLGLFAQQPSSADALQPIGEALLWSLFQDSSLEVVSEVLNSIFDGYAEVCGPVIAALELVPKLQMFLPVLRERVADAKRRRLPRAIVGRADDARLNLSRFIKYKLAQA